MRRIRASSSSLGRALLLALAVSLLACAPETVPKPPPEAKALVPAETTPTPTPTATVESQPIGAIGPAPAVAAGGLPRVGLLVPLSGANAGLGRDMMDAAQLALFELGDEHLILLPRDTGDSPEGAAEAARSALESGARLILGPLRASSVQAVAPVAAAAGVGVVAFSNDRSVASPGVFVMGFLPAAQVHRVVAFARERGLERFAALAPRTSYGEAVLAALGEAAALNRATLGPIELYDPAGNVAESIKRLANYDARRAELLRQRQALEGRTDAAAREELKRLESLDAVGELEYQALFWPEGGERLPAVAPLLLYYDLDTAKVRLIGTGQWDDPAARREPALVGAWFATALDATRLDFEERYRALYGRKPARLATLAYDGVALAAALARLETGPDFSVERLIRENGFSGLDGIFRFRRDGLVERGLAVLE
ncbi:MAG: penicillin-binding protein activator, partial [Alphaproteobacteria bacterium]